jgi:CopA family copper-resistance protein
MEMTMRILETPVSRRDFVRTAGAVGAIAGVDAMLPSYARAALVGGTPGGQALQPRMEKGVAVYELAIAETPFRVAGRKVTATTINGSVPGPWLQLYEGQEALIRVSNRLDTDTSIHWHGLILPPEMDGVPGISFPGIPRGTTFEYRFALRQYGSYWYHSHSGLQEQLGHYGPLIIHPKEGYPYQFDREYVVMLSDWTYENPYRVLDRLKKQGNYYNFQRRTVGDFLHDARQNGFMNTVRDRLMWLDMRMDPTDVLDVTGATYTYLANGLAPGDNWTGLFKPGERVLLHFINASADTFFDVRIPELPMSVVQVSGQYVQPVQTDEFRMAIAETYDVIIEPQDRPYTVFAESMDRSGYARGTLTPREGWNAPIPPNRKRTVLTMSDMGMAHGGMAGMDMGAMDPAMATSNGGSANPGTSSPAGTGVSGMGAMNHGGMSGMGQTPAASTQGGAMAGHDMGATGGASSGSMAMSDTSNGDRARYAIAGMTRTTGLRPPGTLPGMLEHEPSRHGRDNGAVPMMVSSRLAEPGGGLGDDGWRVLRYTELRALEARTPFRAPTREIELHLTGNMERFMWSIDGVPFERADPIRMDYGERIRLTMVNDTMMNHPMHLHGMWMELENGQGEFIPRVHTVNVKPAERLSLLIEVDAPGRWAFHCHVLYHMEVGMFRVVEVSKPGESIVAEAERHGG